MHITSGNNWDRAEFSNDFGVVFSRSESRREGRRIDCDKWGIGSDTGVQ